MARVRVRQRAAGTKPPLSSDSNLDKHRLREVREDAIARIQAFQPYHARNAGNDVRLSKLYILNALENIDKHRRLAVVAAMGINNASTVTLVGGETRAITVDGSIHDGAVLFTHPQRFKGEVHVQGRYDALVVFGEPDLPGLNVAGVGSILDQIVSRVYEIANDLGASL